MRVRTSGREPGEKLLRQRGVFSQPVRVIQGVFCSLLVGAFVSFSAAGPTLRAAAYGKGGPRESGSNPGSSTAQAGKKIPGISGVPDKSATITFASLPNRPASSPREEEIPEPEPKEDGKVLPADAFIQREESRTSAGAQPLVASPAPSTGFQALPDDNTSIPPDTQGAVGPGHLMATMNSQIRIQNKSGGVIRTNSLISFWASLGYATVFDPRVLYDRANDRWISIALSDFRSATSALLVGVSQTGDPNGGWRLYGTDVDSSNQNFADFPIVGFNRDWIVVTVNILRISDKSFVTSNIYVFNKSGLYAGGAGSFTLFQDSSGNSLAPAVNYDSSSSAMHLVENWNGNLSGSGYLRISTVTGAVGSEVLNSGIAFPSTPDPWSDSSPGGGNFAPQFGSPHRINNGDSVIHNVVHRNGSLWCAQTVYLPAGAPTRSGIQWWQLSVTGAILQRGRIEDPSGNRFYGFPSIAVNQNNDALVGYSRFSASQYAGANYAFRAAADPPGTLRDEVVLKGGEAPYFKPNGSGNNKWGDFSSTIVDPSNDTDLWTVQQYAAAPVAGSDRWGTWWGRINPTGAPAGSGDIVLYASEAPVKAGNWVVVSDSTAAGGARIWNPDAGAPKLAAPLANPASHFAMTFVAQAGSPYRLWIRGKAQGDSPYNDSIFMQFSGSVDAGGTPVYRIGTTSGTTINLEDDLGVGLSGWGWQDNGWGVGVMGPLIYFAGSGTQTLKVQAREDGLSIDQIVLSPATYLNAAPGALKNDNTILPKQGGTSPAPSINGITPTTGTTAGGTAITISGANFAPGATVILGGAAAANVNVTSGTTITAVTPAHAAATVNVTVTNSDGQSGTLTNGFTYFTPNPMPQFGRVFIVVEENHSYSDVIGNAAMPYLNSLADKYGLAVNYYANTQPSIGNYFMMTTGQIVTNDSNFSGTVSADNIVRQLTLSGKTWKSYAESLPSVGYTGGDVYPYVKRHNPFAYFSDVINSPAQANNIVPFSQLFTDLANGQLPNYSYIIPNQQHNAHDCPAGMPGCSDTDKLAAADTWLNANLQPLITSAAFQEDGLLIITFDESVNSDTAFGGGHITTVVISSRSRPRFDSTSFYQHESLLRTTAEALGLTSFPGAASTAPNMSEFIETRAPVVNAISPASGSISGGTSVTISGNHFAAGLTVTMGATPATNITVVNGSTITIATPPHVAGAVDVVVTNAGGQSSTLVGGYTYTSSPSETILLTDDFNDNSLNTTKWNASNLFSGFTDAALPVAEVNMRIEIGPLPQGISGSHYAGLRSAISYDFSNAYCHVEAVQTANSSTGADAMLTVGRDVNGYYRIFVEAGSIIFQKRIGGSKITLLTATYNPATDRYWRIRHESASGKVFFETAADSGGSPGTWTVRYNEGWNTAAIPLGAILFEVKGGTWQVEASPPGKVVFDNFRAAK
jgi:phosphatidylinositol-3-phosphatase